MSVIFKSNIRATAVIRNVSGFQGPKDFIASADFSNNQYLKNGLNVNFDEIVSAQTQLSNFVLLNEYGDTAKAQSAKARRSYLVEHNTFGLLNSGGNSNYYYFESNSILLPETNVRPYALYACKGFAKIADSDLSKITVTKGTGTLKDPFIFYYKSAASLKINKSEDAEDVVCTSLVNFRVPFAPFGVPGAAFDSVKILTESSFSANELTIVMRIIEPIRGLATPMSGIANLIKFIQDNSNAITVAKARGSDLRTNILRNGAALASWQAAETNKALDTLVFTVKNGTIRCALNGTILPLINEKMPANFNISKIEIMTADTQWGTGMPEAALLNLVTYNRALSLEEMQACIFV